MNCLESPSSGAFERIALCPIWLVLLRARALAQAFLGQCLVRFDLELAFTLVRWADGMIES